MGIKHLNHYLLKHCSSKAIEKIGLHSLSGKIVVVDISIYIYKFLAEGSYMEHLYLFLGLFHYYQIMPIFIFDGKPPPEKWDIIKKRQQDKKAAQKEYAELIAQNSNPTKIQDKLDSLKKRMVTLKDANLVETKLLIDAFGFSYFEAKGEADELCAYFVLSGIAWACLTDDMDMFLYGCPRIIRNVSMMKKEAVMYHTESIMCELSIESHAILVDILLLSGAEYSPEYCIGIENAIQYYCEYKIIENNTDSHWYYYLLKHFTSHKLPQQYPFMTLYEQFISVVNKEELHIYKELYMKQEGRVFQIDKIKEIMGTYGFIFL